MLDEPQETEAFPVLTLLPGPRVLIRLDPQFCMPFVVDAARVEADLKFWRKLNTGSEMVAALEKAKAMIEAAQC